MSLAGQPVAEKTTLGWTIMSPGCKEDSSPLLLTLSTSTDYEQLCQLDVLGLADSQAEDQSVVYLSSKNN